MEGKKEFWCRAFRKRKWALFGLLFYFLFIVWHIPVCLSLRFGNSLIYDYDGSYFLIVLLFYAANLLFFIDLIRGESATVSKWDKVMDIALVFLVVTSFFRFFVLLYFFSEWSVLWCLVAEILCMIALLTLEIVTVVRSVKAPDEEAGEGFEN